MLWIRNLTLDYLQILLWIIFQSLDGIDDHFRDRRELFLRRRLLLGRLVVDLLLLALTLLFLLGVRIVLDVVFPLFLRALPSAFGGGTAGERIFRVDRDPLSSYSSQAVEQLDKPVDDVVVGVVILARPLGGLSLGRRPPPPATPFLGLHTVHQSISGPSVTSFGKSREIQGRPKRGF